MNEEQVVIAIIGSVIVLFLTLIQAPVLITSIFLLVFGVIGFSLRSPKPKKKPEEKVKNNFNKKEV